jgi:isopentenyldiphosphate isomerase
MELLDIYTDRNEFLDEGISRKDVHEKGFWHRKFVCIIIDEKRESVLFQRQHKKKGNLFSRPEYLNISVGGHLSSRENIKDGIREFQEESGLNNVKFDDLKFLGIRQSSFSLKKGDKNFINNEFQYIHIYKNKFNCNSFNIKSNEETKGFVDIKINDGILLLTNQVQNIEALEYINGKTNVITITKNDFIPDYLVKDEFILRNFIVSQRYLKNPKNNLLFW